MPFTVDERLRWHEDLARHISGLSTPVSGADPVPVGPVWSLDTPTLADWRGHLTTAWPTPGSTTFTPPAHGGTVAENNRR